MYDLSQMTREQLQYLESAVKKERAAKWKVERCQALAALARSPEHRKKVSDAAAKRGRKNREMREMMPKIYAALNELLKVTTEITPPYVCAAQALSELKSIIDSENKK